MENELDGKAPEKAVKPPVAQEPADGLIDVTVAVAVDGHWHQGTLCKKGDKIKVTREEREWMTAIKIIK